MLAYRWLLQSGEVLGGSVTPPDPLQLQHFPIKSIFCRGNAVCAGRRGNGQTHSGFAENAAFGSAGGPLLYIPQKQAVGPPLDFITKKPHTPLCYPRFLHPLTPSMPYAITPSILSPTYDISHPLCYHPLYAITYPWYIIPSMLSPLCYHPSLRGKKLC